MARWLDEIMHLLPPPRAIMSIIKSTTSWYERMVERYPNLKEEVGGLIPGCEISSILDRFLALACRSFVEKKKNKKNYNWLKNS